MGEDDDEEDEAHKTETTRVPFFYLTVGLPLTNSLGAFAKENKYRGGGGRPFWLKKKLNYSSTGLCLPPAACHLPPAACALGSFAARCADRIKRHVRCTYIHEAAYSLARCGTTIPPGTGSISSPMCFKK